MTLVRLLSYVAVSGCADMLGGVSML